MTSHLPPHDPQQSSEDARTVVIGPDGQPTAVEGRPTGGADDGQEEAGERNVAELVEQPAKVMRIGGMIRQLLEEVKSAPLDEASRVRLAAIYDSSIKELEAGLAPELVEELERLSLPFGSGTPSEAELRVAQAQLVGWLEGLFHGIQTVIYAQQMAARAQLEQIRRALPPGMSPDGRGGQPGRGGHPGQGPQLPEEPGSRGGMYL